MFRVNDKVVYPGHGVAQINRIVEKIIAGRINLFYELKLLNKDMTVLVPVSNSNNAGAGVRPLSSQEKIDDIFKLLMEPARKIPQQELFTSNWNKRHKEYQLKIRLGNPEDIATIYRDLKRIALFKELSFGEKSLLGQTELLLAEEIAIVKEIEENKAIEHLRSLFNEQLRALSRL